MDFIKIFSVIFLKANVFLLFILPSFRSSCLTPIIAILTQPLSHQLTNISFINAAFVKFLESAGACVIPILDQQTKEYYDHKLKYIDGILFTGGDLDLTTSPYTKSAEYLWKKAIEMNNNNIYFPLWGTCQGFELFTYLALNRTFILNKCHSWDQPSTINFKISPKNTRLYRNASQYILNLLEHQNTTINYHTLCLSTKNFSKLSNTFRLLTTSYDIYNLEYISSFEALNYPFYGIQFHPERIIYEHSVSYDFKHTPHTAEAVYVSQYFANFFVNEARKIRHKPNDLNNFIKNYSIYNFNPIYTGKLYSKLGIEQTYLFYI